MIQIDGSFGEGGGQVLRTALAMSLVTGRPFRIDNIRAGRRKPGLMRQHLTAANAAATLCRAEVKGNSIGSLELTFAPTEAANPGQYRFAVGTAGSCTLVLQTVLPALLIAEGPSELTLEGGTHNPFAPPFDFLARVFLPIVNRMGPTVTAALERPGFYPAGGGKFSVSIEPARELTRTDIPERGKVKRRSAVALVAGLPRKIGKRELKVVGSELSQDRWTHRVEMVEDSPGPGNALILEIESQHVTEIVTGFGEKRIRAEVVAKRAVKEVQDYLAAGVPVGRHLADQLLIPMGMAGGGMFRTLSPTSHSMTNIGVLGKFLDVEVTARKLDEVIWQIEVG